MVIDKICKMTVKGEVRLFLFNILWRFGVIEWKTLGVFLTPLRLTARMNFSLKNYSCELFNLTVTVGKVELISTFTTAVCES